MENKDFGRVASPNRPSSSTEPASRLGPTGFDPARKGRWELDAVVLNDGHVDRITGPRCMIQMREGPSYGLYFIGRSETVLKQGTPVFYDTITRRVRDSRSKPERAETENTGSVHESGGAEGNRPTPIASPGAP